MINDVPQQLIAVPKRKKERIKNGMFLPFLAFNGCISISSVAVPRRISTCEMKTRLSRLNQLSFLVQQLES